VFDGECVVLLQPFAEASSPLHEPATAGISAGCGVPRWQE
jgi:hypothetical protein